MTIVGDAAALAEQGAESRARRRLLALARRQGWPEAIVRTMTGWQLVLAGRNSWEREVRAWCPATLVTVMTHLYEELSSSPEQRQL
jgi:hypothetical protein